MLATVARTLVADLVWYGLGRWRGPQALALLARPSRRSAAREYSEATAQAIDVEIAGILSAAHVRVRETLTAHRSTVEALAKLLIDKEVVNAEQLRGLLGPVLS